MKLTTWKALALAVVLMFAAAPVMADEHNATDTDDDSPEDDSDREEIEGTDNSTELTVSKEEARRTALNALPGDNWTLESSSTDREDGYYEFEFVISEEEAEAEIKVDGSSGEIFEMEAEIDDSERLKEFRKEARERVEEAREEHRQRVIEARIEAKQRKIDFYQERIEDLRDEIEALRNGELIPEHDHEEEIQKELEFEREVNEAELEFERETRRERDSEERRGPDREARDNVNTTPGNDRADRARPGFVQRMLGGLFG